MIEPAFLTLGLIYSGVIFYFYLGIRREKRRPTVENDGMPFVSVLVPARNEAPRIVPTLESLARQSYPNSHLEVIIIDDQSTDRTAAVVKAFIGRKRLKHFKVLTHQANSLNPTYKKMAISYALQYTRGEIILTTDADCITRPHWVESMVKRYDSQTGFVAGLVTFHPEQERTIFHKLQTLEFAGLVFCGVGAVGNHFPLICNGSNLSYRKIAFEEVGGFAGHEYIASGDDDLFMQNLHRKTNWKIRYNLDDQSINFTKPVDSFSQFINQRGRWASKSTHYPGVQVFIFLLLIYLFYLSLLVLPFLALTGSFSAKTLASVFFLKLIVEFLVVLEAVTILKRFDLLRYFLLAEILQIPYIVLAGFSGFFKLFTWKPPHD